MPSKRYALTYFAEKLTLLKFAGLCTKTSKNPKIAKKFKSTLKLKILNFSHFSKTFSNFCGRTSIFSQFNDNSLRFGQTKAI